jgi:hypothetical protein
MTYFNYVPVATAARKTVAQKNVMGFLPLHDGGLKNQPI